MRVIPATTEHLRGICDIFYENCTVLGLPNPAATRENIERGEVFVAEDEGGGVIGFVEFHVRKDGRATLYHIGVKRSCRRKGIGKELVKRLIQECERRGCYEIRLLCPVWSGAEKFYESVGFECVGEEVKTTKKGAVRKFTVWRYRLSSGKVKPLFSQF